MSWYPIPNYRPGLLTFRTRFLQGLRGPIDLPALTLDRAATNPPFTSITFFRQVIRLLHIPLSRPLMRPEDHVLRHIGPQARRRHQRATKVEDWRLQWLGDVGMICE